MAYNQRLQSQNIVHLLQNRESGYTRVGSQLSRIPPLDNERRFYKCFTPCFSICSVDIPDMIMRKFTPDGSQLLAFSDDLKSLHIYPYRGFSSAAVSELIREANVGTQECYKGENTNLLCRMIFERLFATKDGKTIRLCRCLNGLYRLHREFSVFLANGKYVLVAAISDLRQELPIEGYPDSFDKLDAFSYVFFLVNLKRGVVRDSISLPQDSIAVSLNHGISVSGSKVAIMSRLHQCIYVYKVSKGKLYKQETIESITHIKKHVRSFLSRQNDLQTYNKFSCIEHKIMERVQFISDDLLLLCYEERPRNSEEIPFLTPLTSRPLYVLFTKSVDELLDVYPDSAVDLLSIILLFYDEMHYIFGKFLDDFSTNSFVRNVVFRSQCVSPSPYLTSRDFSYDGWYMSPMESPKYCSDKPIVFKNEATETVKFRLFAKARNIIGGVPPELCTFIWHPFEPFVLSIQKCENGYVQVNVHLYHHGTVVEQTEPSASQE